MKMREIQIVDKPRYLKPGRKGMGWAARIDSLPKGKALLLYFNNKIEAQVTGTSACQCARYGRRPYKPHYFVEQREEKFLLFIWKEDKEDG